MKTRQRGVAVVELGFTLCLLLAIAFAVTEFGRAIYTYNTLAKAARDASRYLTTQPAGDATAQATAQNLAVFGQPVVDKKTAVPLVPGLKVSMVSICDASNSACTGNIKQGSNPAISTVTVTISGYKFDPVLDLLGFLRFYTGGSATLTSLPFGNISVTMRQIYE